MLYRMSKFVPIRFTTQYWNGNERFIPERRELATWWQWRNHIFFHKITVLNEGEA